MFVRADELKYDNEIMRSAKWSEGTNEKFFEIPAYKNTWRSGLNGKITKEFYKKPIIPMNLFLNFLGWYLSEGCVLPSNLYKGIKKGKRIVIVQKKEKGVKELKKLIN